MAAPLVRPFRLALEPSDRHDEIEVRVDFEADVEGEPELAAREIMATFARLGSSGALAGADLEPSRCTLVLAGGGISGRHGRWLFREALIDPGSMWLLLNMIHWLHATQVPLRSVSLAWPASRMPRDMDEWSFPEPWPDPSYDLEVGDMLGDIDLRIDFVAPQPKAVVDGVVDAMAQWLLATHRGAYANDSFDPGESRVYLGPDVMRVGASRIVWYIETMRCDEAALDGLLNLLDWVSVRVAAIREVDVGP